MLYLTYTISVNDDKTLCKNLSNLLFSVKGLMPTIGSQISS